MEIQTKYKPGDHIMVIGYNELLKQVEVYEDYIDCICVTEDEFYYITSNSIEIKEKDIILYGAQDKVRHEIYYLFESNKVQKTN